ncbi:MAG TPA: hypothetical protein VK158_02160 [Acidobacteriota bacterium]|nr:hypothetical protein [Acidobacteriota bacterium]
MEQKYKSLGFIGRFKPFHNGAFQLLYHGCKAADSVVIGIGSPNKYNIHNPFTYEETTQMIDQSLKPFVNNYRFVAIADSGHIPGQESGAQWVQTVREEFTGVDAMVSGNPLVGKLLEPHYTIVKPKDLIGEYPALDSMKATRVRNAMARGDLWIPLVPQLVATYLIQHKIIDRFRAEFAEATLLKTSLSAKEETAQGELERVRHTN